MSTSKVVNHEATVLTANQKAVKGLQKVVADIQTNLNHLQTATDAVAVADEQIAEKQQALANLDADFQRKLDEAEYNLKIKIRDRADASLAELMKERNLAMITKTEHAELLNTVESLQVELKDSVAKAVASALANVEAKHNAELARIKSEQEVALITSNSELNAVGRENTMLKEQVQDLKDMIAKERETSLAKAQADAGRQGVVINQGKNS